MTSSSDGHVIHSRAMPRLSGILIPGRRLLLASCVVAALATAAFARTAPDALPEVTLADLPKEAREAHALVLKGGPFPYERDGVVFGNREKLLPAKPRAYYHEYTVRTPGAKNRGARRLICGGPKTAPDTCYYTDDHYQSFRRIRP
jgi:ribonuclease T1